MNTLIKILAAIALIAVTVAAVVHVITRLNGTDSKPGPSGGENPTTEEVKRGDHKRKPKKSPVVARAGETIKVKVDDPLPPRYDPINKPEILQNMREEGKTYCSKIKGRVFGRAKMRDWDALQTTANFNYIYTMETTGKIIKNDGTTIEEERSFDNVSENCVVSDISSRPFLSDEGLWSILIDGLAKAITGSEKAGKVVREFANSIQVEIPEEKLRELGFDIKDKVKVFTKGKDGSILKGKKVRIVFTDGMGITDISPIDCELTEEEINFIKRTNYAMDHYLMPEKEVKVGENWKIDADVFSGLIDPRLEGKIKGEVTVERISDFRTKGGIVNTRLRLTEGKISVVKPEEEGVMCGEITQVKGDASRPDKQGVVTNARLQGYAQYKELSQHHLLFDATMETEPRFEVRYECEVKDN